MKSVKTNSVSNVVKKATNRKPLTKAQKEAIAKKRALNPQFANVQSARRRTEKNTLKNNPVLCLLEVKRTIQLDNVDLSSYENIAYQNECKKAINFMVKNQDKFVPMLVRAVRTYKGAFVVYYFEQLIQKVVKMGIDKGFDYQTSLEYLATKRELETA